MLEDHRTLNYFSFIYSMFDSSILCLNIGLCSSTTYSSNNKKTKNKSTRKKTKIRN